MEKELNLDNENYDPKTISSIIKFSELTNDAKFLLMYALTKGINYEFTAEKIMNDCNLGKYSFKNAIKCLEKFKYLKRERLKDEKGQYIKLIYSFYLNPYND